jgi:hypothetical protein
MPPKATPRMGVPKLNARWQVGQVQSDISQLYRGQGYAATLQNIHFDARHRAKRQLPQLGPPPRCCRRRRRGERTAFSLLIRADPATHRSTPAAGARAAHQWDRFGVPGDKTRRFPGLSWAAVMAPGHIRRGEDRTGPAASQRRPQPAIVTIRRKSRFGGGAAASRRCHDAGVQARDRREDPVVIILRPQTMIISMDCR